MTSPPQRARAVFASRWTTAVAAGGYVVLLVVVLFPVLAASVGADDSYWLMEVAPNSDGSFRRAFWDPFAASFAFTEQARMTGLSEASRWVLALSVVKLSVAFSVPPTVLWAILKVFLLAAGVLCVILFLVAFRFRRADGEIAGFSRRAIFAVAVIFPLLVVLGVKAQSVGTLNGWLNYPTLTYGPFAVYLAIVAAALVASRALDARFGRRVTPVSVLAVVAGVAVSFDYELMALSVPLVALALVLQPLPDRASWWERWRGRLVVAGAFGASYAASFAWIRSRISQMACQLDGSCYAGTVIEVNPRTLLLNLLGALPGGTGEFMTAQAERTGQVVPSLTAGSLVVAFACVTFAALVLASTALRGAARDGTPWEPAEEGRGMLAIVVVAVAIAIGATVVTGISQRAVELVQSPVLAYRSSVVVWSALSLGVAAALWFAWIRRRIVGAVALAVVAVGAVSAIAMALPANLASAHVNRTEPGVVLVDTIHAEVALGDLSELGDARRCAAILGFMGDRPHDQFSDRFVRTVQGAYRTFDLFYAAPFCSSEAGLDATTGS